ncbi:MAG TPA: hypothetical protein ENF52_03175 [Chloroflexi bacterium]|nr:hypothetical protein [Chloroflexota bacterium]
MSKKASLVQRSIASVSWNVVTSFVQVVVGFARSVLLARWLPVETFGVYRWAGSIVALTAVLPIFGMGGAFLHRAPETEDEEQTAAVHFTLQLVFTLTWVAILSIAALLLTDGQTRITLLVITVTTGGSQLTQTPRLILARRVVHRRMAMVNTLNILLSALIAIGLAWRGATLWALLSTDLVTLVINIVAFYIWRPVWRPRLLWLPNVIRYFLRFGSRNVVAIVLLRALDRVDDLWTGIYLGDTSMGYYSRAYAFATYPRKLLAVPVNMVAGGTYAELSQDRHKLSQAFFRVNAFLIRSGFLFAGLLSLVAPEFISIVLGEKWMPMLNTFSLMLVFTLFDPLKTTIGNLYLAIGRPEQMVKARLVQLAVLVISLFLLGSHFGIAGVALAVDVMLVVGIGLLLWQARAWIDFSAFKLLKIPAVALLCGLALARLAITFPCVLGSDWYTAIVKIVIFIPVYSGVLLLFERDNLTALRTLLKR